MGLLKNGNEFRCRVELEERGEDVLGGEGAVGEAKSVPEAVALSLGLLEKTLGAVELSLLLLELEAQ